MKSKQNKNNQCMPGDTKVLVPIENIIYTKNITHFQIASILVQASHTHLFNVIRKNNTITKVGTTIQLQADEIKIGDMFKVDVSLLSSNNKIMDSNLKLHKII